MQSLKAKFFKEISLFTALICIVAALVYGFIAPSVYTAAFPFMVVFFYVFGFIGFSVYNRGLKNAPIKATNYYLTVRMIKMLIAILGTFIYGIVARGELVVFVITLAVLYLLYLLFETWFYYTLNVAGNKKSKNDETNK